MQESGYTENDARTPHIRQAGASLVELMVATLLAVIIFVGWLKIANFQAIRKESLRRVAIEKAAGYLDIMARAGQGDGTYRIEWSTNLLEYVLSPVAADVQPMFDGDGLVGYVLRVTSQTNNIPAHSGKWNTNKVWAVIDLYDKNGVSTSEAGRPFSTMSVFMR